MAGVLFTCYITAIALLLGAAVASRHETAETALPMRLG
jgi:hypothetical protein